MQPAIGIVARQRVNILAQRKARRQTQEIEQGQAVYIACQHPLETVVARHPPREIQGLERDIDGGVTEICFAPQQVLVRQTLAAILRFVQTQQHAIGAVQRVVGRQHRVLARSWQAKGRQTLRDLGAEQHDDPGQINPGQKNRHRGEGAIDGLLRRELRDEQRKTMLGEFEQHARHQTADQRMA